MTDAQKPASPLVATITDTLHEPNVQLVRRVVKVLGEARAQAVLEETLTLEAAGAPHCRPEPPAHTGRGVLSRGQVHHPAQAPPAHLSPRRWAHRRPAPGTTCRR